MNCERMLNFVGGTCMSWAVGVGADVWVAELDLGGRILLSERIPLMEN